jgi:peptidoglycan DL-endopeptidase CwlO
MRGKRIICSSVLAGIMMFSSFATPVAHADDEKERLNQQMQQQKNDVDSITKEMNTLKNEIQVVDKEIERKNLTLTNTQKNIEVTEAEIQAKLKEIADLETKIEARTEILKKRMAALQKGEKSNLFVDVLLNSESIADMFTRFDSLSSLFKSDEDIMKQLDADQSQLEEEKALVEAKKNDLVTYEKKLKELKARLEADQKTKTTALTDLQNKLEKVVNEMKASESQIKELERQALFVQHAVSVQEEQVVATSSNGATKPAPIQKPTTPATGGVVAKGMSHIGKPYVFGAAGPNAFDCSGYISYVYGVGRKDVAGYWSSVQRISDPQPGDLVFFKNTYKPGPSHMGIYIGNNQMVHAGQNGIAVSNLSSAYNKKHFLGFGRF